ncbi:MAG: DUF362 domain-containing protein [Candidatus Bipolaricaulota bacterium]|nr:MAG: DUF362 domain-containing protein [Candidatus Bipolaricaulota bacterium]
MCPRDHRVTGRARRVWRWVTGSSFVLGLVSLVWFLLRTGTKPSRAAYPCQRAAAAHGGAWLVTYLLPLLPLAALRRWGRSRGRLAALCLACGLLATTAFWIVRHPVVSEARAFVPEGLRLELAEAAATRGPASDVFVVNGATGDGVGVETLVRLMGANGIAFYRTARRTDTGSPAGLIAGEDVVLIKVNAQWSERGGTNTDLLAALIAAVLDHPDGFTGEIVVADNGQAQYGSSGSGGSLDWARSNAEDRSRSAQRVVDDASARGAVSTYLWDTITTRRVEEYVDGDLEDGYVVEEDRDPETGALIAYPKFRTVHGTFISFKRGIWDEDTGGYDSEHLRVINLPVLKSHSLFGVTACVKHYMGVTSDKLTARLGARAHNTIGAGGMGTLIAATRAPTLNLLDAIWVNAMPGSGPATRYRHATRLNVIAASTDAVALDYWAAKHLLMPAAEAGGHTYLSSIDPDNASRSSFGGWLRSSRDEILDAGLQATTDEEAINVYVSDL